MKNLLLILISVMAFTSVKADHLPSLKIFSDKSFIFKSNDWNKSELTLTIMDQDGVYVHEDTILPTDKGIKKYNLQHLPEGDYIVLVRDEHKTAKYEVTVTDNEVSSISEGDATFLPQVNTTSENIDINLMALSKKVKILLTDDNGRILYDEKIKGESTITKRLNIASLQKGNYILKVQVDDSRYVKAIRKH